nr:hypothetical protein [Tanacetum cinerariifolium]
MVIEELDGTYSSVASEDSDDSDFDVEEEDRIEDVEVDMADFRKHTDGNVEWVECNEEEVQVPSQFNYEEVDLEDFASETGSDDNECEIKEALKKLAKKHRPLDGQMYTENFYVSQNLANKQLIKEMVSRISVEQRRQLHFASNDKIRIRAECRGLVPVFGNRPGDSGLGDSEAVCDKPKLNSGSNKKTKKKGQVKYINKCLWLLHCSKLKNAETWWVKIFDDNHTCQQSGTIRKYSASFQSKQVKETIKPNSKVPISALKDQFQKKYELLAGDGVASVTRRCHDQSSNGIKIMETTSGRGRLKEDLESSTWRRHQERKALDAFENDGFIMNSLEDDEEDMLDIDDEKQKKKREKMAEEPTKPPAAAEAGPKKEVAPKPPLIGPKKEELR